MSDRIQTLAAIAVSSIAIVVMVVGLAAGPSSEPSPEDRVAALSEQIICPFCSGESLADSGSGVAADYRTLIEQRVADGLTDQQILAEFEENFGEAYVLSDSNGTTTALLILVPVVLIGGGLAVFTVMRRSSRSGGVPA